MMQGKRVESGCRRLAWAVWWAPRRSPRPDMFPPLCTEVEARTVVGLPTQPGAVLGRRGLPARLLSRRCVPRAACVALRGPLLPRPRRQSPAPCAAGSLRLAVFGAPRLRRAALRPGPCWACGPRAGPTLAPPRPPLRPGLVGAARLRFALGARAGAGLPPLPLGLPLPAAVLRSAVQPSRLVRPPLSYPTAPVRFGIYSVFVFNPFTFVTP